MDKVEEVINDPGNRNIVNVQFITFNKKKQKIKRPFKLGQFYLVSTHGCNLKQKKSPAITGRCKNKFYG